MIFSGRGVGMSMVVGMIVGMIVGMLLGHGSMFTICYHGVISRCVDAFKQFVVI